MMNLGKEEEAGGDRAQEGGSPRSYGGSLQGQEG